MDAVAEQTLLSKIKTLSPQQVAEVDDFVEFLSARAKRNAALGRILSIAPALQAAGLPPMSEQEITAEIQSARAQRRASQPQAKSAPPDAPRS